MGYNTRFQGEITVDPPLTALEAELLKSLSKGKSIGTAQARVVWDS